MMLQPDDVRQYVALRAHARLAPRLVFLDGRLGGRMSPEKLAHGARLILVGDHAAIFGVDETLQRLQPRLALRRPDEPDQFRAFFLVELEPALPRNPYLLTRRQACGPTVSVWGRKQHVERCVRALSRRP